MIAIVDYKAGNLRSVENALQRLGAAYQVTSDPEVITGASHVIMPGVGEASSAMENLQATKTPASVWVRLWQSPRERRLTWRQTSPQTD